MLNICREDKYQEVFQISSGLQGKYLISMEDSTQLSLISHKSLMEIVKKKELNSAAQVKAKLLVELKRARMCVFIYTYILFYIY